MSVRRWGKAEAAFAPFALDPATYHDPARYAAELEVMKRSWLLVCHVSEVRDRGDTFLAEQFGEMVAIVRQDDGSLAAWHAVCAHRTTALLTGPVRGARRFTCPYHHWSYGLDGRLIGVNRRECFAPEHVSDVKLPRVHVAEASGWVWINLSPDAPPPLEDTLGELLDEWAPYAMERSVLMAPYFDVVIPSNWKRALEAFLEVYHVPALHRESTPPDVMKCDQASIDLFGDNSMLVSPLTQFLPALIESGDHQTNALVNYFAFPLSVINNLPMQHQAYTVTPIDLHSTRMRIWLLWPEGQDTPERRAGVETEMGYVSAVFGEDVFIAAQQTRTNGGSGARRSVFGAPEARLAHLHQAMDRAVAALARKD